MQNKTCLVTGATSGHGKALAKKLATMGARVIIHGRDRDKCSQVQQEIASETGRKPDIFLCNLASQQSIKQACEEFLSKDQPLHLLTNNAGIVCPKRQLSINGIELNFAVNYLAVFQMTLLLLDRIVASSPARIVNVSSGAHRIAKLDLGDPEAKRKWYFMMGAYGRSKLALIYFTQELAKRLACKDVTVNAVNPGPIASGIAKKPMWIARFADFIIQHTFPSAAQASETAFYLATAREMEGISGKYYQYLRPKEPKLERNDPDFGKKLWDLSTAMLKI